MYIIIVFLNHLHKNTENDTVTEVHYGNQMKDFLASFKKTQCLRYIAKATPSYLTVRARAALLMPWDCVLELLLFKSSSDLSIDFALSSGPPLNTESTVSNLLLKDEAHKRGKQTDLCQLFQKNATSLKSFWGKTWDQLNRLKNNIQSSRMDHVSRLT